METHMATNPAREAHAPNGEAPPDVVTMNSERRSATPDKKLDEALKQTLLASDAFVVPWEPRALDVGQAD
jgi:hypothetical protein